MDCKTNSSACKLLGFYRFHLVFSLIWQILARFISSQNLQESQLLFQKSFLFSSPQATLQPSLYKNYSTQAFLGTTLPKPFYHRPQSNGLQVHDSPRNQHTLERKFSCFSEVLKLKLSQTYLLFSLFSSPYTFQ